MMTHSVDAKNEEPVVRRRGVLSRLARDKKGNTLAIVGAALVPLAAMIGSGVDMSRAYMAKARLQNACDAAALAGRRVMVNDQMSDTVRDEARRFFNFNFAQGLYQTSAFTPDVTRSAPGTVRVTAATDIPVTIMRMFGYTTLPLSVTCDASQNYVNTDVMLVLDTTGSMLEDINGNATNDNNARKITALRAAVMALYDSLAPVQTQLQSAGMRLRYGVVPYSSTVNVGGLLNAGHVVDTANYQSRVPIYAQAGATTTWYRNSVSACMAYHNIGWTNLTFPRTGRAIRYLPLNSALTDGWCAVVNGTFTRTDTGNFAFWYHEPRTLDTSVYKTFSNTLQLPTRDIGTNTVADRWNGCIEERSTVNSITAASGLTIPAGANDLNINLVPNSNETRWRPQWPEVEYLRLDSGFDQTAATSVVGIQSSAGCPAPARRLQAWTRGDLQTYVDALVADGSTYHDIGMIWGARMISNAGIFADSPNTHNNMPVARHIIFMTDGQLAPTDSVYSAYGVEYMDQRVTGAANAPNQYDRHLQRFRMICNAARTETGGTTIWVIAFGTALSNDMRNCATSANHAFTSANRDQLIAQFTSIGQQIGALRLTQ